MFPSKNHFITAVLVAVIVAAPACSQVAEPVADAEQESAVHGYMAESTKLPAPGTYVARDREGNVVSTGEIHHTSATERVSWVFARGLQGVRTRMMSNLATYSGPDPECTANVNDSEEELAAFGDCTNQLYADPECDVVVTEYFRESGDLHAHCLEPA